MHVTLRSNKRSQQKKELYKLALARSDITDALQTCDLILKRVSGLADDLYIPLFQAAVISYARPFIDNKSTGPLPRQWTRFDDRALQDTHDRLIATRNELVAHSDSKIRRLKVIPKGVRITKSETAPINAGIGYTISTYYYPRQMFEATYKTCRDLEGRLKTRIEELIETLYEGLELPKVSFKLRFDEGL